MNQQNSPTTALTEVRAPAAPSVHAAATEYYPWFDWLRIGLASLVMLSHDSLLPAWPTAGNFAILAFFALSGWLIGGILLTTSQEQLPRFYFNRAVRIWVPYFLALAVLIAISVLHDPLTAKWAEFVFYKIAFVYNLFGTQQLVAHHFDMPLQGAGNHLASVNAEEQFYLLAPLLLVLSSRRISRNPLTWVLLLPLVWWADTGVACLPLGVLAAVLAGRFRDFYRGVKARLALILLLVTSGIGVVANVAYDLLAPVCSISLVLLLAIRGPQHAIGALVGGMSYPLYLNHWLGIAISRSLDKRLEIVDSHGQHVLAIVMSLAIAALLYWHVDRRILAARPRLYTRRLGLGAMAVAYCGVGLGIGVGLYLKLRHV